MTTVTQLGIQVRLNTSYEEAIERATVALKEQGFGVLTEIDVKATLKEKLNVDFKKYKILGACNPPLAYRALTAAPEVGLLLPCNVIVYEDEAGGAVVTLTDPMSMVAFLDNPALQPVAEEARSRLEKVAQALMQAA
ncbi:MULTISPECIES: DUF302 domain-containing protein [Caldilinea]|jgi:uncharacterized protein (DUF302 family)|uniref:DUF302 domain-containing protein n=1 Tax=Caldilinea aerophila (strain DSM 14535 / JCM 11387 / NBRC 104270 / STL-6-O1) TaxID=926550 RepID=I0I6H7_CALAS|nr:MULTISPECIES: DUF302 domain-containing protein [Caldilinea]MBO9393952.1 DUF302 domain-containing protein [Caldilinea sp.]BAM00865.1 hypothetical protein CLDAP_28250 [Caldilinea aerophila DSM 14535 = NBRC 104270]GIV72206.1 MAG: hypothetical protein KatS3mg049_0762 [Caldilinea sp.]